MLGVAEDCKYSIGQKNRKDKYEGRGVSEINLLTVTIEDDELYLNGVKLRGVEEYEVKKSSGHRKGTAELKVSLIVNYSGNRNSEKERE